MFKLFHQYHHRHPMLSQDRMLDLADIPKDASVSIAQCDQSIGILRAHGSIKAAGDIEPIITRFALKASAFASFRIGLHLVRHYLSLPNVTCLRAS
jgi:hypothetical protein